jgi:hypothetical protein
MELSMLALLLAVKISLATKLFYTCLRDGYFDNIMRHAAEMVAETRRVGRLSNAFMDTLDIVKLPEGEHKDRGASCLAQQGPVCLTHAATITREESFARKKRKPRNRN